jgi:hypothetical protein
VKVLESEPEELELLLELVLDDTGGVVAADAELNALLTVPINDSRAGQDEMSYPARRLCRAEA